jgi:ABC-type transport system involved in cytochrome bd biosynthesis fused ATPase/permease subunit
LFLSYEHLSSIDIVQRSTNKFFFCLDFFVDLFSCFIDEATSALDATTRVLVFEAIKRWRANKTTIVMTHDLLQITSHDFAYVLKNGSVVEQGYRYDLDEFGYRRGV